MYKIAVLGDAQSVQGFAALGLQVCPAENAEQARPILHRLAKEDTAIIYVTEQLAAGLTAELDRYRKAVTPAIILIPGKEGSLGLDAAGENHGGACCRRRHHLRKGRKAPWEKSLKSPGRWWLPPVWRKPIWRMWFGSVSSASSVRS